MKMSVRMWLVYRSLEQEVLIIESWYSRDQKFGSIFTILRQANVFSIL